METPLGNWISDDSRDWGQVVENCLGAASGCTWRGAQQNGWDERARGTNSSMLPTETGDTGSSDMGVGMAVKASYFQAVRLSKEVADVAGEALCC